VKIAFDTWGTNRIFRNSGIYGYIMYLLQEFKHLAPEWGIQVDAFVGSQGRHDVETIESSEGFAHIPAPDLDKFREWRLWGLNKAARRDRADVVFVPHTQVIPLNFSQPIVATIHDATPIRTPWQMNRKQTLMVRAYMWFTVHYADRIITDSENSKRDLVEIYGVNPARIQVAYLGYDRGVFNSEPPDPAALKALLTRFEIGRPYLFHHGTIQPRKNLEALVRVHRLLLDRNPGLELDLVLAGPLGWLYESVVEAAQESSCSRGRVILTGALENTDLALLLKGATVSVIPSFYEGFCFPMVEAMACGVPTVVSNSSCLPEVSGGVLRYFSPTEPEEMAEIVSLAIHDSLERQRLREAGLKRAAEFSWRRTGEQTLAVLMDACGATPIRTTALDL